MRQYCNSYWATVYTELNDLLAVQLKQSTILINMQYKSVTVFQGLRIKVTKFSCYDTIPPNIAYSVIMDHPPLPLLSLYELATANYESAIANFSAAFLLMCHKLSHIPNPYQVNFVQFHHSHQHTACDNKVYTSSHQQLVITRCTLVHTNSLW